MIDVSGALKNAGAMYPFSQDIFIEPCEVFGETLSFEDARITGGCFGAEEAVSIEARLSVNVHAHCARCLEPVVYPMDIEVKADYRRGDGEDCFTFTGHEIDPVPAAFECLLTELPMRFLCSEDCKGLCPVCGKSRNKSLCTCLEGAVKPNPFSVLKSLPVYQTNEEV